MSFKDISHLLVYFLTDKSVCIYHIGDVIGWSNSELENLQNRKPVYLKAYFDCQEQKVYCTGLSQRCNTEMQHADVISLMHFFCYR